ncbi:FAD dependent oxidoreductase [Akanthomyces lecanii RCEF 1005]|uniref:FAD dependent oxidoreductase n=1 Tax=Akanthomyces lecanii RCEF 1005 TaxID=1081108 RepID=A0A162JZN0_CORDF|nr:FAD dependent oxidoreductase [Akanthomyces lecanii RCEF 1005]
MSQIIILGGGILGLSTAYFISLNPQADKQITVIDSASCLFHDASGAATVILANNWFEEPLQTLAQYSWNLHREFATEHDGRAKWDYPLAQNVLSRTFSDVSATIESVTNTRNVTEPENAPKWLNVQNGMAIDIVSNFQQTSQEDPLKLSGFLYQRCKDQGVRFRLNAMTTSISRDGSGEIDGIEVEPSDAAGCQREKLAATQVAIAAGAWSLGLFEALFPDASLDIPLWNTESGNSLLIDTPGWNQDNDLKGCQPCVFNDYLGFSFDMMLLLLMAG